ncbi:MAG TPA: sigma-70 family RNA polymerase sigma factor [Blastocatellia bacterium]|nr:sigma-70 family RNA polymerase sigma factor [Blastocatellia bacterium]
MRREHKTSQLMRDVGDLMELSDEQIVQRTLNGETEAFGLLIKRWEKKIYSLALRMLGQSEDARDAAQDVFLTAYRNLRQFRGDARFSSWLYRIAINCCYNKLREKQAEHTSLDEATTIAVEDPVVSRIHRQQLAERVRRAVHALPPELRQVVIMKEYEGLTFAEIAEILNIPVSTAKTRLYTGLDQLRKRLTSVKDAL